MARSSDTPWQHKNAVPPPDWAGWPAVGAKLGFPEPGPTGMTQLLHRVCAVLRESEEEMLTTQKLSDRSISRRMHGLAQLTKVCWPRHGLLAPSMAVWACCDCWHDA